MLASWRGDRGSDRQRVNERIVNSLPLLFPGFPCPTSPEYGPGFCLSSSPPLLFFKEPHSHPPPTDFWGFRAEKVETFLSNSVAPPHLSISQMTRLRLGGGRGLPESHGFSLRAETTAGSQMPRHCLLLSPALFHLCPSTRVVIGSPLRPEPSRGEAPPEPSDLWVMVLVCLWASHTGVPVLCYGPSGP